MAKRSNTRGANGDGTIRKRSDGRWEGRYTYTIDPGSGKQVQKSVYGQTQNEVRKKLKEITLDIDQGVFTEPSRLSVGGWLDLWVKEYNSDVKQSTLDQYKYQIRVHLKPGLGNVKLSALTAPMIQSLYNRLGKPFRLKQKDSKGKTVVRDRPGLSPKSIKNMHSVLHSALDKALKLGYIPVNVCSAVTLPKIRKAEMHPVTGDALSALLKTIRGRRYEDIIYITIFTGLRQGEALGLTWDCINFKTGIVTVYRQLLRGRAPGSEYGFAPLKNEKTRSFMVPKDILDRFRKIRKEQNIAQMKAGDRWSNTENYVFTDEEGQHLSKYTVYNNFKMYAAQAGIPATRFHDLRHSYATIALEQGTNIKTVSANLGHATVAFTLDVYGHVDEQMQKDSADRMQAYLDAL